MIKTTIFVFVLVLVMPDGTTTDLVEYPEFCPTSQEVHKLYDPLIEEGAIRDWMAACLHAQLSGIEKRDKKESF